MVNENHTHTHTHTHIYIYIYTSIWKNEHTGIQTSDKRLDIYIAIAYKYAIVVNLEINIISHHIYDWSNK